MEQTIDVTAGTGAIEIRFSCLIDAPREFVFGIWANRDYVPRWWGPQWLTTTVDRMDLIPGGYWRYVQRDDAGNTYAFHGIYHDVVTSERISYTFEYEGTPGSIMIEQVEFEDRGPMTLITGVSVCPSFSDPDGRVLADMKEGSIVTMKRFSALIHELRNAS